MDFYGRGGSDGDDDDDDDELTGQLLEWHAGQHKAVPAARATMEWIVANTELGTV